VDGRGCAAIVLPEHARIDYSGNNWECAAPYRRKQDACVSR
jgi:hypothetical protein